MTGDVSGPQRAWAGEANWSVGMCERQSCRGKEEEEVKMAGWEQKRGKGNKNEDKAENGEEKEKRRRRRRRGNTSPHQISPDLAVSSFCSRESGLGKGLAGTVPPHMGRGEQNCRNTRWPDSFTEQHPKGRFRFQIMNRGERKPSQHPSCVAFENYYFGARSCFLSLKFIIYFPSRWSLGCLLI